MARISIKAAIAFCAGLCIALLLNCGEPPKNLEVFYDLTHFLPAASIERTETPLNEKTQEADLKHPKISGKSLFMPSGIALSYYLKVDPGAVFHLAECQMRAPKQLRFVVTWQQKDFEEVTLLSDCVAGTGDTRVKVPVTSEGQIGRLRLEVRGKAMNGGVILAEPAILTPDSAPSTEHQGTPAITRLDAQEMRPDIIFYIVDTLRKDRLGCYGSSAQLTPQIDAFAESATVFERALAQSPWTKASMASMFTGLVPRKHAAVENFDILAESQETLAEVLAANDYQTAAIVANINASDRFGFAQGFEDFELIGRATAREVNKAASEWLKTRRDVKKPTFLHIHTVDPHAPYEPPLEFGKRFAPGIDPALGRKKHRRGRVRSEELEKHVHSLRTLYDAEVAFSDTAFGEFLSTLEKNNLRDNSLILFSSDHGEEFLDHGGWTHGKTLYDEILSIPLIVRFPGQRTGTRVRSLAQHADLLPTILDLLGLRSTQTLQGQSLIRDLDNERRPRLSFSEMTRGEHQAVAMDDGDWKIIRTTIEETQEIYELYNLDKDPKETNNLYAESTFRKEYMKGMLALAEAELGGASPAFKMESLTSEVSDELRALGYLE